MLLFATLNYQAASPTGDMAAEHSHFVQLLSTRQLADIIVHSYPYMPMAEVLLDTIAAQSGYPSQREIEAAAHHDSMAADWELFGQYAKFIASQQSHNYLQMCQHVGSQRRWLHCCPSTSASDQHTK